MKVTILGSGTSCGVPQIGCNCSVCSSSDPRDKRLRCSAMVDVDGHRILIDCGPDFREQMLRVEFAPLDAVLITHEHYDHVGGLDDLRPYSIFGDVDVYAEPYCAQHLLERIPYCFTPKDKRYPGVPAINLLTMSPHVPIIIKDQKKELLDVKYMDDCIAEKRKQILQEEEARKDAIGGSKDLEIIPIRVYHGKLPIVGFKIKNFLYITDMKTIPEEEFGYLGGIDTVVVNGLRHKEHPSHQTIEDAIAFSDRIGAKETYLIHMSHHILPHEEEDKLLPVNVHLAYDGLSFEV